MRAGTELNFNDGLARWSKWKNPSQADALRILGPSLQAVCLDANIPAERAIEWLQSQGPETITAETVRNFVRSVTEAPADVLAAARARQRQIEAQIASERPLTARDRVLLERKQPLKERSRQSIQDELTEANTGRMADGTELPHIEQRHWAAMETYYASLERELEQRDCAVAGIPYSGDRKKQDGMVGYAMSPR